MEVSNTIYTTLTTTANNGDGMVIFNSNLSPRCEKCKEIIFSIPRMGIFHRCKEPEANV